MSKHGMLPWKPTAHHDLGTTYRRQKFIADCLSWMADRRPYDPDSDPDAYPWFDMAVGIWTAIELDDPQQALFVRQHIEAVEQIENIEIEEN